MGRRSWGVGGRFWTGRDRWDRTEDRSWRKKRKSRKNGKKKKKTGAHLAPYEYMSHDELANVLGFGYMGYRVPVIEDDDIDDSDLVALDIPYDDYDAQEISYGKLSCNIVGIQYYHGTVNRNEMVDLVREPFNQYDRNAVKVTNMDGVQVGHIKRELARPLAHIMDHKLCRVEGTVPFGIQNTYSMPVELTFWGRPEDRIQIETELRKYGYVLRQDGLVFGNSSEQGASSSNMTAPAYTPQRTLLTPAEMKNELDKLFEDLHEHNKSIEMESCQAVNTKLFKHQKQALKWMADMENGKHLPPFWREEKTGGSYYNSLTISTTMTRPKSVRGGILADDMGLGKTLVVIALVLTNFVEDKVLAVPVDGHVRRSRIEKQHRLEGYKKKIGYEDRVIDPDLPRTYKPKKILKIGYCQPSTSKEMKQEFICDDESEEEDLISEEESESEGNSGDDDVIQTDIMMKGEDPEFVPKKKVTTAEETVSVSPLIKSRPKRTIHKPTKYAYSDSEGEEDLKPPSPKEGVDLTENGDGNYEIPNKKAKPTLPEDKSLVLSKKSTISSNSKGKGKGIGKSSKMKTNVKTPTGRKLLKIENNIVKQEVKIEEDDLPDLPSLPDLDGALPCLGKKKKVTVIEILDNDDLPDLENSSAEEGKGKKVNNIKGDGRTKVNGARTTLIVCPLSVVSNWTEQFEDHLHECVHLKMYTFYGQGRTKDAKFLAEHDVVFTTYSVLTADFKGKNKVLQKVHWLRVVLDEGHIIRNPATQQCKAAVNLKAERRWVLTGTPIQNSIKDLWSLVDFLKIKPFTDKVWWHRTIVRPLNRGEDAGLKRVQHLMGHISMRRTKNQEIDGEPIVNLPKREVYIEHIDFSKEERDVYEAMQKEGKLIIGKYFRQGKLLHHYGEVLAILMRLRQLCCHPALVAKAAAMVDTVLEEEARDGGLSDDRKKQLIDALKMVLGSGSDEECPVCLDSLKDPIITRCAHIFCSQCIQRVITQDKDLCPLCRTAVDMNNVIKTADLQLEMPAAQDPVTEGAWQSSTKVDALMLALVNLRKEDHTVKSIVVSQFTSFLTVLETPLRENGFKFARLDGTMSAPKRVASIESFSDTSPGSPTIFLLSLKAGGVGLNLVAASRVYLLDPAWNPATEEQCFDRCHRLGQTRDVIITKFIVNDSVEVRMLELQDKKRELMQGAFKQQTREERQQQRIRDIKTLIDI